MSSFIETNMPVVGFCFYYDKCFMICGNDLIQADAATGKIERYKQVFKKDGKSRLIQTNGQLIAVSDFCVLSIIRTDTFEKIYEQRLGNVFTDDICGLMIDESFAFVCIRHGGLIRLDLSDFSKETVGIGTASSWSLVAWEDKIFAGTVDGQLLRIDRNCLKIEESLPLSRQNVKSLYKTGSALYAAGQDKKLYVIDLPSFSLVRKTSNIHPKMFDNIGEKNGILYTVSHPAGEISGWEINGTKVHSIHYPLRLSGSSVIFGEAIYISSRNINGIDKIGLFV